MAKEILAIFDFCETLVDFQTLARFLEIVNIENKKRAQLKNDLRNSLKFWHRVARFIYRRTHFPPFEKFNPLIPPNVKYPPLHDLPLEFVENLARDFFKNELLPRVNKKVIEKLKWHKAQGHTLAIGSGGLEIYIQYFAAHFGIPVENIIAIELENKNGKLTGDIAGIHTMEHRKLYKFAERFDLNKIDLKNSYFYSDCASDIPLLSFVGNPVVIDCGKDILWAKILGYEIL